MIAIVATAGIWCYKSMIASVGKSQAHFSYMGPLFFKGLKIQASLTSSRVAIIMCERLEAG